MTIKDGIKAPIKDLKDKKKKKIGHVIWHERWSWNLTEKQTIVLGTIFIISRETFFSILLHGKCKNEKNLKKITN